jgi:hypothetical protein
MTAVPTVIKFTTLREITGGSPYGASCVTGAVLEVRMHSALELEMCRFQVSTAFSSSPTE